MKPALIHLLKTIRYRFDASIAGADQTYPNFQLGHGVRTPLEILLHLRGLVYYAQKAITGQRTNMADMAQWDEEIELFYEALGTLEGLLPEVEIEAETMKRMIQGPLADALTHIGQLAMLSRVNGHEIAKQNYFRADIS